MARILLRYMGHNVEITPNVILLEGYPVLKGIEASFVYKYAKNKWTKDDVMKILEPLLIETLRKLGEL